MEDSKQTLEGKVFLPSQKPASAVGAGKLLKADPIAENFRADIQQSISEFISRDGRHPKLVGILATQSKPSEMYAEFTRKTCVALGVDFALKRVGIAASSAEGSENGSSEGLGGVEETIVEANLDNTISGIMVYYPIFGGLQDHYLQQVVSPAKDVEGLNVKFHYNLYHNIRFISPRSLLSAATVTAALDEESPQNLKEDNLPKWIVKSILPCTSLAIVKCLEYVGVYNKLLDYGDRAYGRTVTVINRSEVVGRPLAALLSNDGARVFSIDIDSIQEYNKRPPPVAQPVTSFEQQKPLSQYYKRHVVHPSNMTLEECLALSDVVVSAVPSDTYKVKTEALKHGCICVNVSSEKNFESNVRDKASLYIPAVGKVTILMLLRNL
ncbi:uncharacterized protein EI90DRAFT_2905641 [Cantharellus anzutake]|uniref:uncharacterized protein n=1 Tax=Cantharellus anzutake TaxID=1750568 RepID=UPI0019070DEA|nr:uncharacterized protein EI90DRAFT_2905641 [Cantharellus anzutake]KAF8341299.1 hypothetical protein EI90DRAFT_2905641 [Cantharellus anzutake]